MADDCSDLVPEADMKWTKEAPKEEGVYWVKYKVGLKVIKTPGLLYIFKDKGMALNTLRWDLLNHGEFWHSNGKKVPSLRFGDLIPYPED